MEQDFERIRQLFRQRLLGEIESRTLKGKPVLDHVTMALRATKEFEDGMVVQLGYGIPTFCASFIPPGKEILFHSENGLLGFGPIITSAEEGDSNLVNAQGQFVSPQPGMSIFSLEESFTMIRGGHIDISVMGGIQVSEEGDLANWLLPSKKLGPLGGAMDMAYGAKKLIVVMEHVTGDGKPKIVKRCTCELTARRCVNLIITDIAVIEVTKSGLVLKEIAPQWTPDEVQELTEPRLIVASDLKEITIM